MCRVARGAILSRLCRRKESGKEESHGGDPIFVFCSHALEGQAAGFGKYNFSDTSTDTRFWMVFSQLACQANQQIPDS